MERRTYMKTALFSSGFVNEKTLEYRNNNFTNLIDIFNPDIYFHTYESEFHTELNKIYNIKKMSVENPNAIQKFNKDDFTNLNPDTKFDNCMHMFRKRKLAFDLIDEKYDFYIYTRLDIAFWNKFDIEILDSIDENTILVPNGGDYEGGLNDMMAIGRHKVMKTYSEVFDYIPTHNKNGCRFHPETLLKYHLTENNINIERFHMPLCLRGGVYNPC